MVIPFIILSGTEKHSRISEVLLPLTSRDGGREGTVSELCSIMGMGL